MKKIFTLILVLPLVFASCSSEQTEKQRSLQALNKQKDSLQKEVKKLNKQLVSVNKAIAAFNTNFKLEKVHVAKLKPTNFEHYFPGHGDVIFDKNVVISPELGGELKAIFVNEGQSVKKGQKLIALDLKMINANIRELKTNLKLAKTMFKKNKALYAKKIIPEVTYLQSKTNYESLESRLQVLMTQKSKTQIQAPFSGVVDEIYAKEGQVLAPGMPILRLINDKGVYARVFVSERFIDQLAKGTKVLYTRVNSDIVYQGKVSFASRYINAKNRSFAVHIDPMSQENKIRLNPNEVLNVNIRDFNQDSTLIVPSKLIQTDIHNNQFVYLISTKDRKKGEAKIVKRIITTGKTYEGHTMISKGLKEGEYYVSKGAKSVQAGEIVKIKAIDIK